MQGVEGHDALSRGAGGRLDAHAVLEGLAHQAVGICLPQVGLAEKGQLVQIVDGLDVVGGDALFLHLFAVVGHVVPDMFYLLEQTLVLQPRDILAGHALDLRLIIPFHKNHSLSFGAMIAFSVDAPV